MDSTIHLVDHPLVQHKLSLMREKTQPTASFRQLMREVSLLLAYEVTRDLPLETTEIHTPLELMKAPVLSGKKLCFVSILRAGNGLLEGMLDLLPSARVGHVGIYRDPDTLNAIEYYYKVGRFCDCMRQCFCTSICIRNNKLISSYSQPHKIFICFLSI